VSEGEEQHVKNDDEIDESHRPVDHVHLKFELEVYLLNYTIKNKKKSKKTKPGF